MEWIFHSSTFMFFPSPSVSCFFCYVSAVHVVSIFILLLMWLKYRWRSRFWEDPTSVSVLCWRRFLGHSTPQQPVYMFWHLHQGAPGCNPQAFWWCIEVPLQEIDFKGFQGKYDFFYMPMETWLDRDHRGVLQGCTWSHAVWRLEFVCWFGVSTIHGQAALAVSWASRAEQQLRSNSHEVRGRL